jgi:hypothetical protein
VVSFIYLIYLPLYSREKAPGTHFIGTWVGPRDSLNNMEKKKFLTLLGLELLKLITSDMSNDDIISKISQ